MSYAIVADWTATEGEEEAVADLLRQLASLSRTEAGCQLYRSHRSTDDPRSFMIYEVYDDAEALEAHRNSEHFQRLAADDALYRLAERRVETYQPLDEP